MEAKPRAVWTGPQRRGPIPKDVSVIKENSPYAPGRVPALFIPARYETNLIETAGSRTTEQRTGAHTDRPKADRSLASELGGVVARRKPNEQADDKDSLFEESDLRRLRSVMRNGPATARSSLPELDAHGREVLVAHLGLPRGLLNRSPAPDVDTYERAKRCAIHANTGEPLPTSAPKEEGDTPRKEVVAAMKTRVVETKGLGHAKDLYRMPERMQSPRKRRSQPTVRAPEPVHVSRSFNQPSNDEEGQRTNIGRLQDSVNLLLQRTKARPQRGLREGRYASYWDALQKDDEYLVKTSMTQDFKGRRALNQPPDEMARYRAAQLQYLWRRQALQKEAREARAEEERRLEERRNARAASRRKKEEETAAARREEHKRNLMRLGNIVFKALCTDPTTGRPTDPKAVFRRLDTDKSGTVDVAEFRRGLEYCKCFLSDEEIHVIWDEIDEADGGERDGQVDYAVLVAKLQAVNETALRKLRAPESEQLRRQSAEALEMVRRKVSKAERESAQAEGCSPRAAR